VNAHEIGGERGGERNQCRLPAIIGRGRDHGGARCRQAERDGDKPAAHRAMPERSLETIGSAADEERKYATRPAHRERRHQRAKDAGDVIADSRSR